MLFYNNKSAKVSLVVLHRINSYNVLSTYYIKRTVKFPFIFHYLYSIRKYIVGKKNPLIMLKEKQLS